MQSSWWLVISKHSQAADPTGLNNAATRQQTDVLLHRKGKLAGDQQEYYERFFRNDYENPKSGRTKNKEKSFSLHRNSCTVFLRRA